MCVCWADSDSAPATTRAPVCWRPRKEGGRLGLPAVQHRPTCPEAVAAANTHIFSRFSAPLMLAGSSIVLTATTEPRQRPLYTCDKTDSIGSRQKEGQISAGRPSDKGSHLQTPSAAVLPLPCATACVSMPGAVCQSTPPPQDKAADRHTFPKVPSPSSSTVCMLSMSCALLLLLTFSCRRRFSTRSAGSNTGPVSAEAQQQHTSRHTWLLVALNDAINVPPGRGRLTCCSCPHSCACLVHTPALTKLTATEARL